MELVQAYGDGHPWLGRFKAQQFSTSQRQVATVKIRHLSYSFYTLVLY